MNYLKDQVLERVNARALIQFLFFAGAASILPFYIHLQWITGPIVNAIIILTLFICGIRYAIITCLVPSLMALAGGLLPPVLAPAIPFIMIGNIIFVFTIEYLYNNYRDENKGYFIGVGAGAFLKFIFLYLSIQSIVHLLTKQEFAVKVAQMMGWMQLVTALTGGLIAFGILKWLKRI